VRRGTGHEAAQGVRAILAHRDDQAHTALRFVEQAEPDRLPPHTGHAGTHPQTRPHYILERIRERERGKIPGLELYYRGLTPCRFIRHGLLDAKCGGAGARVLGFRM
jgi:hypothetical protein